MFSFSTSYFLSWKCKLSESVWSASISPLHWRTLFLRSETTPSWTFIAILKGKGFCMSSTPLRIPSVDQQCSLGICEQDNKCQYEHIPFLMLQSSISIQNGTDCSSMSLRPLKAFSRILRWRRNVGLFSPTHRASFLVLIMLEQFLSHGSSIISFSQILIS